MKKALISPLEPRGSGYRVAWTNDEIIDHAPPFFWVDCADEIEQDVYWYDPSDETIKVATENEMPLVRTRNV